MSYEPILITIYGLDGKEEVKLSKNDDVGKLDFGVWKVLKPDGDWYITSEEDMSERWQKQIKAAKKFGETI